MNEGARGRRRRSPPPPRQRWWLALITILAAAVAAAYLALQPKPPAPVLAEAGEVQSAVAQEGDSLQVVVRWRLSAAAGVVDAESLRVEVRVDSMGATAARAHLQAGARREDTLYVPAPSPGGATDGLSCVATRRRSMISRETCTPWRYVRPLAELPGPSRNKPQSRRDRAASDDQPVRIVVQPSGLQVDPDLGGRCADWQRRHPTTSVWIDVNRIAVPACTGPNKRPTVAQFCAFAELPDGRRVKTANAANNPYCDRLFQIWERERLS